MHTNTLLTGNVATGHLDDSLVHNSDRIVHKTSEGRRDTSSNTVTYASP